MIPKNNQGIEAGKTAAHHPAEYIRSKIAGAEFGFGLAMTESATAGEVELPDAKTDAFIGVSTYSTQASKFDEETYSENDPVGVMETGIIMVEVTETVTIGDDVRFYIDDDGASKKGKFCKDAVKNKTMQLTRGAEWFGETVNGRAPLYLKGSFALTED